MQVQFGLIWSRQELEKVSNRGTTSSPEMIKNCLCSDDLKNKLKLIQTQTSSLLKTAGVHKSEGKGELPFLNGCISNAVAGRVKSQSF